MKPSNLENDGWRSVLDVPTPKRFSLNSLNLELLSLWGRLSRLRRFWEMKFPEEQESIRADTEME